ncbi:hypothetical protein K1719_019906 [Acacia pycnantha]|nr:hypothetical protein K1719_019906 [Acacia pycnantha]
MSAAMGFAFAAGTTDGPGAFDFKQGMISLRYFLSRSSELGCSLFLVYHIHRLSSHYSASSMVDLHACLSLFYFQSSQPAGRRLRDAVRTVLSNNKEFGANIHVVVAGLTNTYSHYVTTFEEYEVQRYEGASTLYSPHTLSAYIREFQKLADALLRGQPVELGPQPPNLLGKQISLLPPVVVDGTPLGVNFGDVITDIPKKSTFRRGEMVSVKFWSACPRNDLMTEVVKTFQAQTSESSNHRMENPTKCFPGAFVLAA